MTHTVLNLHPSQSARDRRGRALELAGYRVRDARTTDEAVGIAHEEAPDVIVLPALLLEIAAVGACRALAAASGSRSLIVCTGPGAGEGWELETLRAGATACLPGEGSDSLIAQLQALLPRHPLLESEERLRSIATAARIGLFEWHSSNDSTYWSPEHYELFGYEPGSPISWQRWQQSLHAEDRERVMEHAAQLLERARSEGHVRGYKDEYRITRVDGAVAWLQGDLSADAKDGEVIVRGSVRDITERKRVEAALRESEQAHRLLVQHLHAGVVIHAPDTRILFANERACFLLGLSDDQMMGKTAVDPAWCFVREDATPMPVEEYPVARVLATQTPVRDLLLGINRPATNDRAWVLVNAFPYFDEDRRLRQVVTTFIDITALVEADRRKNEFLAVLSHELRNPLAPIANSLYILDRAPAAGEQANRARQVIGRQVAHLSSLVNDLLDVTRITRNKIQLQKERLELNEVVRRAVEDNRSLFDRADVRLAVTPAPRPVPVIADRTRVVQVVGNLLQNAAKFTLKGGCTRVSVAMEANAAVVRVADDGVGIPAETLAGLFQPFMQADHTLERSKGGLGLGLALVKGLVELHGGSVSARSGGLGKGTEFVVRLPLDTGVALECEPTRLHLAKARRRILIIEDNIDAADSLREALELGEHEVVTAHDGHEALAKARVFLPEVVLCDIGLPGMDGFEVARAFRADGRIKGAFLVALSGYALPEDLQRASEAGFERHLAKPPSMDRLEQILAEMSRRAADAPVIVPAGNSVGT